MEQRWGVVFADICQGDAITESGIRFHFPPGSSLFEFLYEAIKHTSINRVFLCGALPAGYMLWLTSPDMYRFWRTQARGHMLAGNKDSDYVARYEHRTTGKKLDIRSIEHWFSDAGNIFDARAAMLLLSQYIRRLFPLFGHLSGTPSTTFSVLWQQYNALEKKHFDILPEDIRKIIHDSTGQGRIEYFGANAGGMLPGLFYYDGIFMYAALTWGLPTEIETHDFENCFAGKQLARYRLSFRVPADWQHIGPFGVRNQEDAWFYPGRGYQGQTFETWVDGAELDALVGVRNLAGGDAFREWNITILERIIYKNNKDCQAKNPLDGLINKLVKLRLKIEDDAHNDVKHARAYSLARAGMRNIVLHGIGAFNRQVGTRTYILLPSETPPVGFIDRNDFGDGRIAYVVPEEENKLSALVHPEWPACVWGRCRARIFKHAVGVPYEHLIAIRTDAIAVARPMADWESGKKVGELRRKWAVEKRFKGPSTSAEFDSLQRRLIGK